MNILMQLRKCVNHPYLFDGKLLLFFFLGVGVGMQFVQNKLFEMHNTFHHLGHFFYNFKQHD